MAETQRQRSPRCVSACKYCRLKKIKCNGGRPCGNCIDHNEDCVYPDLQRATRKRKSKAEVLEERFSRIEAFLHTAKTPRMSESGPSADSDVESLCRATPALAHETAPCAPVISPPISTTARSGGENVYATPSHPVQTSPFNEDTRFHRSIHSDTGSTHVTSPSNSRSVKKGLTAPSQQRQQYDRRHSQMSAGFSPRGIMLSSSEAPQTIISPPTTVHMEQTSSGSQADTVNDVEGNTSYLAICARPAMEWMSRRIGVSDFTAVARELTSQIWGNRRSEAVQPQRTPEPDFDTAWSWSQAHFDRSYENVFGGIDRQAFESRLIAQFENWSLGHSDDCAWYALRNTIYASGCRITLASASLPETLKLARREAYRYFENALSVHTELIYARSGVAAVQALMSMAYFSEGTGDLALEHMLLSNAVRLAQSKDLHLQARVSATLTEEDVAMRHALWWNLYIHDKHLALRTGRPSIINDADVTSPVPNTRASGDQTSMEFYRIMIEHSQITSLILKRLSPRKKRTKTADHILRTVESLDQQLHKWHASLPPYYKSAHTFAETKLPDGILRYHVSFITLIYNSLLIVLHTVFCYPWNRLGLEHDSTPEILAQRQRSINIVASAAREIIVVIQGVGRAVGAGISSVVNYFPIVGLYNLFLHVLQQPTLPTVQSDLALMDAVVGHYGYLEYISASEFSTQFPRQLVSYAREFVRRSRDSSVAHDIHEDILSATQPFGLDLDPSLQEFILGTWDNLGGEDWSLPMLD